MGIISDEFMRDLVKNRECTQEELNHWVKMGWFKNHFIDCNDFGGKTMSEEAQKGFSKNVIDVLMIEIKQNKKDYREWKKLQRKKI